MQEACTTPCFCSQLFRSGSGILVFLYLFLSINVHSYISSPSLYSLDWEDVCPGASTATKSLRFYPVFKTRSFWIVLKLSSALVPQKVMVLESKSFPYTQSILPFSLSSRTHAQTLKTFPILKWSLLHKFPKVSSNYTCCSAVLSCFSCVQLFETWWTVARQAPLSMGFSRQEYLSGLPGTPLGDLPDPGIELMSPMSPALTGRFFTTSATWETEIHRLLVKKHC